MDVNDITMPGNNMSLADWLLTLGTAELTAVENAVVERVVAHREQRKVALLAEAKLLGISLPTRTPKTNGRSHPAKGKTVPPKYRLGDKTWTGRGVQPTWLKTHLRDNGGTLESLAI